MSDHDTDSDARPTVERLASEDPDACPVDGLACRECPSYCLEVYPAEPRYRPGTAGGESDG